MSPSVFQDKTRQPSMDEVLATVGSGRPLWESLAAFVETGYRAEPGFKFYSAGTGWVVWFRRAGKTLFAMYPRENGFQAQVILGPAQVTQAIELPLSANARKALEDSHPYPEGRWLLFAVESERDAEDVRQLLGLKLGRSRAKSLAER